MSGSLTHTPANVLQYLMVDLGLGTLPTSSGNWPIYNANEPDTPDNCITLRDVAGVTHGREQITGVIQEHEGIQIRIRSTDHATGWTKANAIKVALDSSIAMNSVSITTSTYMVHAVTRKSGPFDIGTESPSSKRRLFTINAVVSLRQVS
ncbi:minor capsid protein [Candidatus Pacearchaeota archaeon]|jgi:hypothetical protein|nr:minor capsid protein [Candidatus Pacearchaeota archaeon]